MVEYNRRVEEVVKSVRPLLIYLRQDNIADHTRKVWGSRGQAIERELVGNMERTPYLRRRRLRGFEGVIWIGGENRIARMGGFLICSS